MKRQFKLNLPADLADELERQATKNGRSVTKEIVERIARSFDAEKSAYHASQGDPLAALVQAAKQLSGFADQIVEIAGNLRELPQVAPNRFASRAVPYDVALTSLPIEERELVEIAHDLPSEQLESLMQLLRKLAR